MYDVMCDVCVNVYFLCVNVVNVFVNVDVMNACGLPQNALNLNTCGNLQMSSYCHLNLSDKNHTTNFEACVMCEDEPDRSKAGMRGEATPIKHTKMVQITTEHTHPAMCE